MQNKWQMIILYSRFYKRKNSQISTFVVKPYSTDTGDAISSQLRSIRSIMSAISKYNVFFAVGLCNNRCYFCFVIWCVSPPTPPHPLEKCKYGLYCICICIWGNMMVGGDCLTMKCPYNWGRMMMTLVRLGEGFNTLPNMACVGRGI